MPAARGARQHRPLAEQYEQWTAHLRRQVVSRRSLPEVPAGPAGSGLVTGPGAQSGPAVAAGTIADGFLVNGRHLSYGDDPTREMWVGGQLFNLNRYNAVAHSPSEPAEVEPAKDGTTYVTVGTAGTPRYGWSGPHEKDRNFISGPGNGVVVAGDAKKQTGPYVNERDFSYRFETVDWSQARYADYGFIALDVVPAAHGSRTTMTLRFIDQQGRERDRAVFSRTAGQTLA